MDGAERAEVGGKWSWTQLKRSKYWATLIDTTRKRVEDRATQTNQER